MIYLKRFILVAFFSFSLMHTLVAEEKVFYINVDSLVKETVVGKKILKKINDLNKKNIDDLEKKNKDLLDLENKIKNRKNIISEIDFAKEVKDFQEKVKNYTNEKDKIVNDFNLFRKKEIEKLFNSFNPIISNYMKENNINILLDSKNIFVGKPEVNLTKKIIEIINKELK